MDKFHYNDFNVIQGDENGHWIRIEELNEMIKHGVITVNDEKIKQYHEKTRIIK